MKTTHYIITITTIIISSILTSSSIPITISNLCNQHDKKVLLNIRNSLGNLSNFPSWTEDGACCDWFGVTCGAPGAEDRVTGLSIKEWDTISGVIPAHLAAELPYLNGLYFTSLPGLVGGIPSELKKIPRLRYLTITTTNVSGPIPDFLGELKHLQQLDLSNNHLSGTIPPSLGTLPKLALLRLNRNQLSGSIPESLGNLVDIVSFSLAYNRLSGQVPKSLGKLHPIVLDLSRNRLSGDASFLFGGSKSINTLTLARNFLEFDFSKVVPPKGLAKLDVSHNMIYGTIPKGLLKGLLAFNASYNRLCGEIPKPGSFWCRISICTFRTSVSVGRHWSHASENWAFFFWLLGCAFDEMWCSLRRLASMHQALISLVQFFFYG
ncbi:Polygalacturonase inhibitor [Acorus calamus]|uniref:Polygalacturonase inhibitor n=1 Tax=Acorus calamus TaxID=4465 RepID=A0AAV9C189_ACOCL|nr:Polygalacturonase inhibitor [Acorus calamus]